MANFTAMAAARHTLLKNEGWDVEAHGLFGAPEITVITGDEVHVSMLKALNLIGFGRERIIRVPADSQGRIMAEKIPVTEGPTITLFAGRQCKYGSLRSDRRNMQEQN